MIRQAQKSTYAFTHTHTRARTHAVLPHKSHYSFQRYGQIHIELYEFLFYNFTLIYMFFCCCWIWFHSSIVPFFFAHLHFDWKTQINMYTSIAIKADQLIDATTSFVHRLGGRDYSKYSTDVPFLCPSEFAACAFRSHILSAKLLSMNEIGWFASSMTKFVEGIPDQNWCVLVEDIFLFNPLLSSFCRSIGSVIGMRFFISFWTRIVQTLEIVLKEAA